MNLADLLQFLFLAAIIVVLMLPLGRYMAKLFAGEWVLASHVIEPIERLIYRLIGIRAHSEQSWGAYTVSALIFNFIGGVVLFALLLLQDKLPLNPQQMPGLSLDLAFNIASSFTTNTNWQSYSGETTLSLFSQMVGLTVQNFLSAATGLAVAVAVVRGFTRRETKTVGNFYVDVTRATLYVLLPLALVFTLFLIAQGVPDTLHSLVQAKTLEGATQNIALGPVASQISIKMLGSNGGGYFNANGAHPFENPTVFSNAAEFVTILLLPISLVVAFGRMVGDRRQGWALMASMTILFLALFGLCLWAEQAGNPLFTALGIDQIASATNPGGNMEGKELRFGTFNSALWTTATSATSNGSVNAMIESFTPIATLVPMFNMLVGEVIYGGIGCGLYGILVYVLITVFIAGLMVGRTPEYLGKKIEAYEIKLALAAMLLYPVCVLGFGVISLLLPQGAASLSSTGPHGLSQMIYAYASAAANNGSAFGGLNANTPFQNTMLGVVMLIGRFGVIVPVLAIAGSLATKRTAPVSSGTFPTHGPIFVILLTGVIILFGGLTYFPTLALGPIAEHLAYFTQPVTALPPPTTAPAPDSAPQPAVTP